MLNSEDFARTYKAYFTKLVRFSQAYILSKQDAENIVQDTFLYLWENSDVAESIYDIKAFLFTLVKNRCIDFLRKQTSSKTQPISSVEESELQLKLYALQKFDENIFIEPNIESTIENAIQSLPEKCREIFVLSRFEGLRYKEIASRLNISTNTIEGQISIALKKLREKLKDYMMLSFLFF